MKKMLREVEEKKKNVKSMLSEVEEKEKNVKSMLSEVEEKEKNVKNMLSEVGVKKKEVETLEEKTIKTREDIRELNNTITKDIEALYTRLRREETVTFLKRLVYEPEDKKGNRDDLIEKANKEIEILSKYLPEQLSEEEIDSLINKIFEEVKPESQKDMGKIMNSLMPHIKGKADMSIVNSKIRNKLNS